MKFKRDWSAFERRPKPTTPFRPRVARAARIAAGYSLRGAAGQLGISHPTIHSWETGKCHPPETFVVRLERLYRSKLG
mgnify:FL=1